MSWGFKVMGGIIHSLFANSEWSYFDGSERNFVVDSSLTGPIYNKHRNNRRSLMVQFRVGDTVRVKRGPFTGFIGIVEKVSVTKSALVVPVDIFGRPVPVVVQSRAAEKVPPPVGQRGENMN
jgi:hypothetical protein